MDKKNLLDEYEQYKALYGQAYIDELNLEAEVKQEAEEAVKKTLELAKKQGEAGESKLGNKFTGYAYETCRDNIKALVQDAKSPKKTAKSAYRHPMLDLLKIYQDDEDALIDMMTMSGLSTSIGCAFANEGTATNSASLSGFTSTLGIQIKHEADLKAFYDYEAGLGKEWAKKSIDKGISQRAQTAYKLAYVVNRMHKEGYEGLKWTLQEQQALGAKVLEAIMAGSNFVQIENTYVEKTGKTYMCLVPTEWFLKAWTDNENKYVTNAVHYPPMLIPPKHWERYVQGGYYGDCSLHVQLIRLKSYRKGSKTVKRYNKKLSMMDLSKIYGTLNAMQDTPFRINPFILEVLKQVSAKGGDFCGVPRMNPYDPLPRLPEDTPEDVLKEHKKRAVGYYKREEARKSKALKFFMELKVAEKYVKYPRIYFPWNIDYRGRCYPICTTLSPQGDDIGKSLLLFANPQPIKADDWKWLAIHGANLAGHDKVSFEDRQKWVVSHTTDIIASADDPLGYQWWYEESKGDYPLEFLAFCNEWKNLQTYKETHGTYEGFMSSLPLAFDGTCSGLQHFSALLRDEVGGYAVNLVPSDKVQDIYSIVAEKVNKVLLSDAKCGMEDQPQRDKKTGEIIRDAEGNVKMSYGSKTLAQNWVVFNRAKFGQDGITRKVCKRSVMTFTYGSGLYGFKENLLSDIIHPYVQDHPDETIFLSANQAAVYMAKLILKAVKQTVVKAAEGMEWLQKMAKLICKTGEMVSWVTPNNLLVQQTYMKEEQKVIKLRFNKTRIRLYEKEETEEVNSREQANGISPNFIHSMDATHLQRVVLAEKAMGNDNFMMIHDSFGTDCAHAGELYKTIREEFVNLYKDKNHLQNFYESIEHLIPEEDKDKVPPIPSFGNLDLDEVRNSQFCFA